MLIEVLLPLVGTLAAAAIAGTVALYIKRLERLNSAELRHSEIREQAYNKFLAACDRAWHLRVKRSVDRYRDRPVLPDDEFNRISSAIDQQAASALEDLQRYSRNYKTAGPILARLHFEACERNDLGVIHFESARSIMQELQREEDGLRKELGLVRKASWRQELRMRRQVRHLMKDVKVIRVIDEEGAEEEVYHGDGEAIWAIIQGWMKEWDELEASVKRQETRSLRWKSMGFWPELRYYGSSCIGWQWRAPSWTHGPATRLRTLTKPPHASSAASTSPTVSPPSHHLPLALSTAPATRATTF